MKKNKTLYMLMLLSWAIATLLYPSCFAVQGDPFYIVKWLIAAAAIIAEILLIRKCDGLTDRRSAYLIVLFSVLSMILLELMIDRIWSYYHHEPPFGSSLFHHIVKDPSIVCSGLFFILAMILAVILICADRDISFRTAKAFLLTSLFPLGYLLLLQTINRTDTMEFLMRFPLLYDTIAISEILVFLFTPYACLVMSVLGTALFTKNRKTVSRSYLWILLGFLEVIFSLLLLYENVLFDL